MLIIETQNKCHWIWHALNPKYALLKPFRCIFPSQNQKNVKFLPEILIFQEQLIIETQNKCHWIWHVSNPKYALLKPFRCIYHSQNQQNVKFLPEIFIFQELLIIETWNLCHWIQHASNPRYTPLKPFQCIFPSQNQQNVRFLAVCLSPPDKKWKKTHQFVQGKSVQKGLELTLVWLTWAQMYLPLEASTDQEQYYIT